MPVKLWTVKQSKFEDYSLYDQLLTRRFCANTENSQLPPHACESEMTFNIYKNLLKSAT